MLALDKEATVVEGEVGSLSSSITPIGCQAMHTWEVTPGNKPPKIPQNSHLDGV